jgi:hypothetical protein
LRLSPSAFRVKLEPAGFFIADQIGEIYGIPRID